MRNLVLLIILILNLLKSYAQEDTLFKKIQEVVITGQISKKTTEETVHKIRTISAKKINSGLFTNLGQVLEKELNFRLSEDIFLGSSISIQGVSGQNVKILIDDIPVIGRLDGNIDLSQISLNNIERIEIIEGPLSTIYGTDALAGTINIITNKNPNFKKSFNTYYETIGKYNFNMMLSNQKKDNLITYQFELKYFNGWSENQDFKILPTQELADKNRFKEWKPKEQFINKIQYQIQKKDYSINNYIESFYEKITNRGMPREPYFENAFDEYFHTYRTNFGSNINLTTDKKKLKILLAYNSYIRAKETFYKDLTTLTSTLVEDASAQDTSTFNLKLARAIISNIDNKLFHYQFILEAQSETAEGERILDKQKNQADYAISATLEYYLNKIITLRPSARVAYNTNYNVPFIPSLNILANLNNYKLRLGIAKGYRAPSMKELYLNFADINHNIVGNSNLSAEESSNIHINNSYTYQGSSYRIQTDIDMFYNYISNKIDLTNQQAINNQYSYFNIDKYQTKGITSNLKINKNNTELNIGISHIGRYNQLAKSENITEFNFSTDYSFNTIMYIGNRTKVNLFYKHVGKLPTFLKDEENIVESNTDAYNLLDLSINRRIGNLISLSFGGKNLLNIIDIQKNNSSATIHSSTNNKLPVGYGRTYFISLNYKL
ncbi:MAG: hypothetical protein CMD14_02560 [Flavobacteriales bacterium]|nr:hypothetical protein [Flavobacteriales bacterium]|tara:strand:- start:22004 stop:24001 length:1998 start_codon:yes stop_codon:yes gene_type:complete